jgi:hypothetical protein
MRCFIGLRQVTNPCRLQPAYQTSGSFPPPVSDIEAATPAHDGPPQMTRIASPACRTPIPADQDGCPCGWLPRSRGLPRLSGGSASATSRSRLAQASLTLRPAGWLNCPRRLCHEAPTRPVAPPSRSSATRSIDTLSGWILPPRVTRPVWAHGEFPAQLFHLMLPNRVIAGSGAGWSSAESMKRKRELWF